jgi:hypothetical protein
MAIARLQEILDEAHEQVAEEVSKLKAPRELRQRIDKILAKTPALPWDRALLLAHQFFQKTERNRAK